MVTIGLFWLLLVRFAVFKTAFYFILCGKCSVYVFGTLIVFVIVYN